MQMYVYVFICIYSTQWHIHWVLDASIPDLEPKLRAQIIKNVSERIPLIAIVVEKIFIAVDLSIPRHFNFTKSSLFFWLFYLIFSFFLSFFFFFEKNRAVFMFVFQLFFAFYFELVSCVHFINPYTIDFDVI